jgi:beta-xylosidase
MKTYTNPVYSGYFADPFVLHHQGVYFAYGTGKRLDANGRAFEVLTSNDLINWVSLGGALEVEPDDQRAYWAPEVVVRDGIFYMFYSVGVADSGHSLRVATSSHAAGPFTDGGVRLIPDEPFAIDAHPFCDDDGQWYLYYAKDFLEGQRVGTALSVIQLEPSLNAVQGSPQTVLRANHDWQIYARNRQMYGQVLDWHTLEGPFVVKRAGRYWCFYSGGAWIDPSYGVACAVADHPMGPWHELSDSPNILKSVPGRVIGPGHNSIITTSQGTDYLVYHAWDSAQTARRMCIDRLEWTDHGPRSHGPTDQPQPAPMAVLP